MKRIATLALMAALALVACSGAAAPTPQAPVITVGPSPSPSPQLTTHVNFLQHATEFMKVATTTKKNIADDVGSNSNMGMLSASVETGSLALEARDFTEWLDAHAPMPCYAEAWSLYREGAQDLASGADLLTKYLRAAPNGQESDFTNAQALMTSANSKIWGLGFKSAGGAACATQ